MIEDKGGFAYYRLIDRFGVVNVDGNGPGETLLQVRGGNDPICYTCSLKFNQEEDVVTIAVAYSFGDDDLKCCVCGQSITRDPIISEIHAPNTQERPHKTISIGDFKVRRSDNN